MRVPAQRPDLTKAIQSLGMSPHDFATEKLGLNYQAFRYRVRKGRLSLEHIWKIMHYTGKSFDVLFPNPYQINPKPINLTLRTSPKARLTPVKRTVPESISAPTPLPVYEQPKPAPVIDFEPIDVYGGLPPVE